MDHKAPVINKTGTGVAVKNGESHVPSDLRLSNEPIIVHCADDVEIASVTLSLIYAATHGKRWATIKLNRATTPEVFCFTPAPSIEVQRTMAGVPSVNKDGWYKSICPDGIGELPLFDALGFAQLKQKVIQKHLASKPPSELLILEARLPQFEPQATQFALTRLRDELRKMEATVILVIQGADPARLINAMPRSDALFVESCAPDPDAILAFKIRPKPFGALWLKAPDSVMVSLLRMPAEGRWRHEPYLASDPISRELLKMREAKMSLEEIGKKLDLDKSTVKRRLDKLRFLKHG
jgi:hypothetical protein